MALAQEQHSHNNSRVRIDLADLLALRRFSGNLDLRRVRVGTAVSGMRQARIKGRGMEYAESRLYTPGDEIRNLDWRVMARTGKVYTKLFQEERQRPVFIVVDYCHPMFFATRGKYKAVMASECAAILAWSALRQGDRIGGLIFSERQHLEWEPKRGPAGVHWFIHQMVSHPVWQQPQDHSSQEVAEEPGLHKVVKRLRHVVKPGSIIFIVSDFRRLDTANRHLLSSLVRHNELVMLFISDPFERELPTQGLFCLSNGQEEILIDCNRQSLRLHYQQQFMQRLALLQQLASLPGAHLLECSTQQPPLTALRPLL